MHAPVKHVGRGKHSPLPERQWPGQASGVPVAQHTGMSAQGLPRASSSHGRAPGRINRGQHAADMLTLERSHGAHAPGSTQTEACGPAHTWSRCLLAGNIKIHRNQSFVVLCKRVESRYRTRGGRPITAMRICNKIRAQTIQPMTLSMQTAVDCWDQGSISGGCI